MAYARLSDTDVYVYEHVGGYLLCQVCRLTPRDASGWHGDTATKTRAEMAAHLREHVKAGHDTGEAIPALEAVIASGEPEPTPDPEYVEGMKWLMGHDERGAGEGGE